MISSSSDKFYDRFSFLYPVIDIFLKPQKQKLFRSINCQEPGRLLDIGVGNGAHFKFYHKHEIIGIDTSAGMLEQARKHLTANIQLAHMSGEDLSFPNDHFDYVVLSHVIAVVRDPEKLLQEVHRVVKPNGKVFILNHFTPNNWLMYMDRAFERIARVLFFKSVFNMSRLNTIGKFNLLMDIDAGLFSYFRILVYEKKV